jgi:hypothetical protein
MAVVEVPGKAQFPAQSVNASGDDLGLPTADLLRELGLLPKKGESAGPATAFTGTPDSVAVIEAGATALSKGWAAGMGAMIVAVWSAVKIWYPAQGSDVQVAVILAAGFGTAALVGGIAYIVGSDVRGRASASVATLEARSRVAEAMIRQSAGLYKPQPPPTPPSPETSISPISPAQEVHWRPPHGPDEPGWEASMMRVTGDKIEYRLTKGKESAWVPVDDIRFE